MNIEFPVHMATSLGFFAVASVLAYYVPQRDYLIWFAGAAFCFFLALGPARWLGRMLPDEEDESSSGWVILAVTVYVALVFAGVALGVKGLLTAS